MWRSVHCSGSVGVVAVVVGVRVGGAACASHNVGVVINRCSGRGE